MRKYFILLVLSVILFSCKKEEKDDSYEFLYNTIKKEIRQKNFEHEGIYDAALEKYKSDSIELKKCGLHFKLTSDIIKKLNNLNYKDRAKVLKYRDSVLKILGRGYNNKEVDKLNLNDSVFKKMIQYKMYIVINDYLAFHVFKPTALKNEEYTGKNPR
jgi:hypothetical protein